MFNILFFFFCLCVDIICNYFSFVFYKCTLRIVMFSFFLDVRGDVDLLFVSIRIGKLIILDFYEKIMCVLYYRILRK